jgi:3-methyladenine DNA glycosylase AlkD
VTSRAIQSRLRKLGSRQKAADLQRFFKTGPGEYGEGDVFRGVTVPASRKIAREFKELPFSEIKLLLRSPVHEERFVALLILVTQFPKATEAGRRKIYEFYLRNTKYINNWDLVDLSAHHIVGAYLLGKPKKPLHELARSACLWERRISIIATFQFIRHDEFSEALKIAKRLLHDEHDLIHKAVGWMIREVGNRDLKTEEGFLKEHYHSMPRTMLRYAIEKFPEAKRLRYLHGRV